MFSNNLFDDIKEELNIQNLPKKEQAKVLTGLLIYTLCEVAEFICLAISIYLLVIVLRGTESNMFITSTINLTVFLLCKTVKFSLNSYLKTYTNLFDDLPEGKESPEADQGKRYICFGISFSLNDYQKTNRFDENQKTLSDHDLHLIQDQYNTEFPDLDIHIPNKIVSMEHFKTHIDLYQKIAEIWFEDHVNATCGVDNINIDADGNNLFLIYIKTQEAISAKPMNELILKVGNLFTKTMFLDKKISLNNMSE